MYSTFTHLTDTSMKAARSLGLSGSRNGVHCRLLLLPIEVWGSWKGQLTEGGTGRAGWVLLVDSGDYEKKKNE